MEVGLGPGHIVLDGNPVPPSQKRGHSPLFLTHVYCGQTGGCISIPLGTEVGLGPGDIVRWGPSSTRKWAQSPNFRPMCINGQTAGWIKMPLGTKVCLGPCHILLDGDPLETGTTAPFLSGP